MNFFSRIRPNAMLVAGMLTAIVIFALVESQYEIATGGVVGLAAALDKFAKDSGEA